MATGEVVQERLCGVGLDRLHDQAGALAHFERLGERGLAPGEVAPVAERVREPVERVEADLRPADLLGQLVRAPVGSSRIPATRPPRQCSRPRSA